MKNKAVNAQAWVSILVLSLFSAYPRCLGVEISEASPFLPPAQREAGRPVDPTDLKLVGIMSTFEGNKYCVHDSSSKTSVWVGINEPGPGFVITAGSAEDGTVTLIRNGRQIKLTLRKAKMASGIGMPSESPVDANSPSTDATPGSTMAAFSSETLAKLSPEALAGLRRADAAEKERMKAAAEEVQRRQYQMLPGANGGGPAVMGRP